MRREAGADGARSGGDPPRWRADPFVEEALRWLPDADVAAPADAGAYLLLADDNADMREYLTRVLRQRWRVEAVADGEPRSRRRGGGGRTWWSPT